MEIIQRKIITKKQATEIDTKFQISYNNFGHLSFRIFKNNYADTLIVLTASETAALKSFLRKLEGY
jgi:hypothetical protein